MARSRARDEGLSPRRARRRRYLAHRPWQRPGSPLPLPMECLTMKLAKGLSLQEAVREAKDYLHAVLAAGAALRIGRGSGPVHHFHR